MNKKFGHEIFPHDSFKIFCEIHITKEHDFMHKAVITLSLSPLHFNLKLDKLINFLAAL